MKRMLTILLTVLLMVSLQGIAVFAEDPTSGTCGDKLTWSFEAATGTLTVDGIGAMDDFDEYSWWDGVPWRGYNICTVIIGDGVTSIGDRTFCGCTALNKVSIPNTVTHIGDCAFSDCSDLTEITIPNSVKSIGFSAFDRCSGLAEVTIPKSVTSIGSWAFKDCIGLTELTISDGVTSIGGNAFSGCTALKKVNIPGSVTSIEPGAFGGCTALTEVTITDGATMIGGFECCTGLTELTIPDSVTSIGPSAFYACTGLTKLTIPDSVTTIDGGAFANCSSLTELVIPDGVTSIQGEVFAYCSGLTELVIPDSVTSIGDYAFEGCIGLTEVMIPSSVTSVGQGAFYDCSGLTEVSIPNGVTFIAERAFQGCSGLQKVTIPGSVTSISKYTFKDCTALSEIVIPEGIKNVFAYAFEGCTALKKVTLPVSICYIGEEAFNGCSPEDIYYGGTLEQWGWVSVAEPNDYLRGIKVHPTCTGGHKNEIVTPAIAPTCDARGQTESAVCAECGVLLRESSTILPLGHCYDLQSGICERCGKKNPDHFPVPFTDIANADWFAQSVMWAYKENITGGTSATTFGPNDSCTRAQVVTFLWAANGKPEPKSMDNPFTDVANDAWYLKPVLWAVEQKITGGVADGKFGPDQTCTRAQIATFLYAAKGKPEVNGFNIFKDVADDAWYAKPIIWAANNNVTGGIGNGKFGPNNTCTRAQVVTFLYKVYG